MLVFTKGKEVPHLVKIPISLETANRLNLTNLRVGTSPAMALAVANILRSAIEVCLRKKGAIGGAWWFKCTCRSNYNYELEFPAQTIHFPTLI